VRALSSQGLLAVWERGAASTPPERALAFLAAALPSRPREELAGLTAGERDAVLLALRERTLGPDLRGRTECPVCGSRLEFVLPIADVYVADRAPAPESLHFEQDGYLLHLRLPTARDLSAAGAQKSVEAARALLLSRALLAATRDGQPVAARDLPEEIVAALGERLSEADPQAEVELRLSCARCGHGWSAYLDIGQFFWAETTAIAERLLGEVHALAGAYGWREADILAMSAARRHAYIERIGE